MIAVTGCSGWVGKHVCARAEQRGFAVIRDDNADGQRRLDVTNAESIKGFVQLAEAAGVSAVIHCAGKAHDGGKSGEAARKNIFAINASGTKALCEAVAKSRIRRFVHISSIKVSGDVTLGNAFDGSEVPKPRGDYAESKWRAEQAIGAISRDTGLEVTIIRPPLLCGAGVKGNLRSLRKAILTGLPLPFGLVNENRRSLGSVRNFSDLLITCAMTSAPRLVLGTFLYSDSHPLSTRELIELLGQVAGKRSYLVNVPVSVLQFAAKLAGKQELMGRLTESLVVDGTRLREALCWTAPYSLQEDLSAMVQG